MEYVVSAFPILLLFVLMLIFRLKGWVSALVTLAVTALLAMTVTEPAGISSSAAVEAPVCALVGWSVAEGMLKAVFPIFLIILTAIYSYNIVVASGQIESIKKQLVSLTDDRGILVLIMVWGFGGLLEGMAGFGTAVAIPAAILIGLGFKPFFSALAALLGNTVATGFAALGVPVTTLCNEATAGGNAPLEMVKEVSGFTVMQLSPLFFLIPFAILMLTDRSSWKKNLILAIWTGAVSLATQWACAVYLGAETPAIVGSIAAILSLIAAAKAMSAARKARTSAASGIKPLAALRAWSVYISILVLILLSGSLCPPINSFLKTHLVSEVKLPVLNTIFRFGWISNASFIILLGSIAGGLVQGVGLKRQILILGRTFVSLRTTGLTIVALIALASVMNHMGMINTLARGIVALTGHFYPLFAPLIGAVGTFVTGSDTSSNILFAKLQASVAANLGIGGEGEFMGLHGTGTNWLLAANTTGATGGKMLSPQSIAIATAACDIKDSDDAILRAVIPYALVYVLLGGLLVFLA